MAINFLNLSLTLRFVNLTKYGLKQTNRQCYSKLSDSLLSFGYVYSTADHSLFIKSYGSNFTALLVYIDDIVLTGNDLSEIQNVKTILHNKFRIKDLGALRYFLGLEVVRSPYGILLKSTKLYFTFT